MNDFYSNNFTGGDDTDENANVLGGSVIDSAEYEAALLVHGGEESITGLHELNKAFMSKVEGGLLSGDIVGAQIGKNSRTVITANGKKHRITELPNDDPPKTGSGRHGGNNTQKLKYLAKKRQYEKFISGI